MATRTRLPKPNSPRHKKPADRRELVLRLRELLIHAARTLADEVRPDCAATAVVTVELRDGEGSAAIRFPSRRE